MSTFTITTYDGEEATVHLEVVKEDTSVSVQSREMFQGYPFYILTADTEPFDDNMCSLDYAGWNAKSASTDFTCNDLNDLRTAAVDIDVPVAMIDLMIETLEAN